MFCLFTHLYNIACAIHRAKIQKKFHTHKLLIKNLLKSSVLRAKHDVLVSKKRAIAFATTLITINSGYSICFTNPMVYVMDTPSH